MVHDRMTAGTTPQADGPCDELRRLRLGSITPAGWLLAQMRRDLEEGFAGRLDELSPHVRRDIFRDRLEEASGHAAWWDAESRGNWLWGYVMLAGLTAAHAHVPRARERVEDLRSTQDADGYLGIHAPGARFPAGGAENGELWAQSRALLVLLAHHELTGDTASLEAARDAADLTLRQYGDDRPHFGRRSTQEDHTGLTHGLCFVDALEMLHEATADERYRAFAAWLLRDFDRWPVPFPNDDLAAANLADPHRALRGHAVHAVEHLRAIAFGAPQDRGRIDAALRKLASSTTPSGAVIGDESLHGLPGPSAAYEYCTLTELSFSLTRLAQRTADPSLGDWLERLTFNAAQGARTSDGRAIGYLASDTRLDAVASRPDSYSLLTGRHGRFKLSPTHDDVACCCNPNATRLLPHYVASMWMTRSDEPCLVALAYGPSKLRTTVGDSAVTISEETRYPFEDEVRFTVDVSSPVRMSVQLRQPAWVASASVDGVEAVKRPGWIVIERRWEGRQSFTLRLAAPVRAETYAGGEVAVLRGPLQFVEPISHVDLALDVPGRPGWPDRELRPSDVRDVAAATPIVDPSAADLGFAIVLAAQGDPDDPWAWAPVALERPGLRLVPMGCAPLRRAAFISRAGT
jgi:hypothetical protein